MQDYSGLSGLGIHNVGVDEENAVRYCGAGIYICSYDVDGEAYPCQFFMPLSLGEKRAEEAKTIEFPDKILPQSLLDEKCQNCVVRSVCPNCFGANYAATGNIYSRDNNMCKLTKIILKARSYFVARKWELNLMDESPDEKAVLLRAAVKIQEMLKI